LARYAADVQKSGAPVFTRFRRLDRERQSLLIEATFELALASAAVALLPFRRAIVRGSTPLGEQLGPKRLHELMDRFYQVGTAALIEHDALIDRFMGDQVVGYFVPGFAGAKHARKAIECALAILRATGHADAAPWVPVGAGVHTGTAFVGAVGKGGEGDMVEFTAIGDAVNIAARLASVAQTGEIVVTEEAFGAADVGGALERRALTLKGVSTAVKVRVLRVGVTP
jgi:adenylate cyclase